MNLDVSNARVHDGPPAEAAATDQRAHAFAYGSHVVLGRATQRAAEPIRLAVLAHELAHVGQQSRQAPANDNRFDHQPRAPPGPGIPELTPAPLGVMRLGEDDDSIIPRWASDAAHAVAAAGEGAYDAAADAAGSVAEFAVDSAAGVIDVLAPGLLPFLRGGALGQLTDLFCSGIDMLLGSLFSSLGDLDFMSAIEATFAGLAAGVRSVLEKIGGGNSKVLGLMLRPLVDALQQWGGPLVATIQSVATTINAVFGSVWDGLAVPALDILERMGGAVWEGFTGLATWVWDLTEPVRTGAETAWNWLLETFDLAWNSTSGVREWLGTMASTAWTAFLETIEPIRGPLEVAGGIALLLSPVGPVVVLTQVVPPLWEKITWLWNNWNTADILVRARTILQDDILPGILGMISGVATALGEAASWLAGLVGQFGSAMSGVLGAFGASRCLTAVTTYLNGVAGQFNRLAAWAESGFAGLSDALHAVFDALDAFFRPILDFLVRLTIVALNPPLLPLAIAGAIWLLCPEDLKPPVIDFVLDLLIAFVDGSTLFLIGLGPMALVLQAGTLGFLRGLRGGEDPDDRRRIEASNKIASLAAGGGPAFVLGFSLGFLLGVIDGVIDPFRLIFLIARTLVAGAQAIGRVFAPYLLQTVPGAADAVASVREALAVPPAAAAQPAAPQTEGATGAQPAAATPGPAAAAAAVGDNLPSLEPAPGEPSDAQIVAALGPGVAIDAVALGSEPSVDDAALAADMHAELETEGATVGGLARLLGDAWNSLMQGAEALGRRAADAMLEFILQPDYQLGRKLGFVTGFLALQALIIYLTVGGYAVASATAPLWRQVLALFLRFMDLGGELLGLLGRALRPLRGPLMAVLTPARSFLSNFRFARGLIELIERVGGKLFGLGDEAAAIAGRGAREVVEETGERTAREVAETTGQRVTRETAEEGGERASREVIEDTGEKATRETTEEAAELARRKTIELPVALAAAQAIAAANDVVNTPVPALLLELNGLRTRFRWIEGFRAIPVGPGIDEIEMLASIHNVTPRYTTLPTTPAEIHRRVDDLRNSGRIEAQSRVGRRGRETVEDQLDKIERDALLGQEGAQGEIAALERKVFDQGQTVELIPDTKVPGRPHTKVQDRTRPDMRAPAQGGARELLDVKTTVTPRSQKGWDRWIKQEINDTNTQIADSGLRVGSPGAVELQAFDQAAVSLRALTPDEVLRSVFGNFNPQRGRSLQRVSIFADGSLLYEFTRAVDGSVSRTFP